MVKSNTSDLTGEGDSQPKEQALKPNTNSATRVQFDINARLAILLDGLIESMEAVSYAEVVRKGIPVLEYIRSLDEIGGILYTQSPTFEKDRIYPARSSIIHKRDPNDLKRIQLDCNVRINERLKKLCIYFNLNQSDLLREIVRILHQMKSGADGKIYRETDGKIVQVVFPLI